MSTWMRRLQCWNLICGLRTAKRRDPQTAGRPELVRDSQNFIGSFRGGPGFLNFSVKPVSVRESLFTREPDCSHINGQKRFNQLSLSRNSFLIFIVFLLTFSWNIWRLYKLRHEVADEDVPEWTVDQFDYHFHAFLRIFLSKMEFSLKFYEKMLASETDLKRHSRK